MRLPVIFLIAMLLLPVLPAVSYAQADNMGETNFTITVKARDSKFIGSSMGGAQVVIRDRRNGDVIAQGVTHGGTGNTDKLMAATHNRDEILVDENTAKLQFSLELFEPVPVTISATGPMAQPQATVTVSEDTVLIPGKDYTDGNGIMLELPGFAVDILSPPANMQAKLDPKKPVNVLVNVLKMCGCHIAANSPWPPERYEVEARIYKDGVFATIAPLAYAGEPAIFAANLKLPATGLYKLVVTAYDRQTKEAGMDVTTFVLTE